MEVCLVDKPRFQSIWISLDCVQRCPAQIKDLEQGQEDTGDVSGLAETNTGAWMLQMRVLPVQLQIIIHGLAGCGQDMFVRGRPKLKSGEVVETETMNIINISH